MIYDYTLIASILCCIIVSTFAAIFVTIAKPSTSSIFAPSEWYFWNYIKYLIFFLTYYFIYLIACFYGINKYSVHYCSVSQKHCYCEISISATLGTRLNGLSSRKCYSKQTLTSYRTYLFLIFQKPIFWFLEFWSQRYFVKTRGRLLVNNKHNKDILLYRWISEQN